MIGWFLPGLRLVSEANQREHWRAKAKRAKRQRALGRLTSGPVLRGFEWTLPLTITITRLGAGTLDSDNLAGCAKALRDGITDVLRETHGVSDDSDERVTWVVRQERCKRGEDAVRVEVTERDSAQKSCGELDTTHASEQSAKASAGARVRAKR